MTLTSVTGRTRSRNLSPFDRPYMSFYRHCVVSLPPDCLVSEISLVLYRKCHFFTYHPHLSLKISLSIQLAPCFAAAAAAVCSADLMMGDKWQGWPVEAFDLFHSLMRQRLERECNRLDDRMKKHLDELCEPTLCHSTGLLS